MYLHTIVSLIDIQIKQLAQSQFPKKEIDRFKEIQNLPNAEKISIKCTLFHKLRCRYLLYWIFRLNNFANTSKYKNYYAVIDAGKKYKYSLFIILITSPFLYCVYIFNYQFKEAQKQRNMKITILFTIFIIIGYLFCSSNAVCNATIESVAREESWDIDDDHYQIYDIKIYNYNLFLFLMYDILKLFFD